MGGDIRTAAEDSEGHFVMVTRATAVGSICITIHLRAVR